ncbi:MAG: transposase [Synergistaceae bacterium]|nr:transposase [Synergistaceae bacterium]
MNSKERIAYLRGLLDFMPKEEKETKVYSAIVDALAALAAELGEQAKLLELQREDYDSLADEVDDLHDTLYQLEESLGLEEEDESGVYEEEEDDGLEEMTESYVSMTCPACAYSFYYKYEEGKEDGKLICPSCGEEFSRGGAP